MYDIIIILHQNDIQIATLKSMNTTVLNIKPYQLFIVVSGEIPHVDGATLVPDNEGGLVRVETHAIHRSIHLEQPLTLLTTSPGREDGDGWVC